MKCIYVSIYIHISDTPARRQPLAWPLTLSAADSTVHSTTFYFSFQPVLHDWCNKGSGMCYPVCGMVHIKEPLLLIGKSSLCGGSKFPLSLSEWSLNKTFPSFYYLYNSSCTALAGMRNSSFFFFFEGWGR